MVNRRPATQIDLDKLILYIETNRPSRLEVLRDLYTVDKAGERKFHRHLDELKSDGYEIIQDGEHRYTLLNTAATRAIFGQLLTKDEQNLLERLRQEISPQHPYGADFHLLLGKLAGKLNHQTQQLEKVAPLTYLGPRLARDYTAYKDLLDKLNEAIQQKRCIRFTYTRPVSRDLESVQHIEVEPQRIEIRNGVFYLFGYSIYTHRQKTFFYRVDKIKDLQFLNDKFAGFRNPEAEMIDFEYLLHPSVVKGGVSQRFHRQEVVEIRLDGSAHIRARDHEFWIKQEILRMGRTVRLLSPAQLVSQVATEIEEMYSLYQNKP